MNVLQIFQISDLQVWNHTIKQSLDTEGFCFCSFNVDTEFPIADSIASDAETFEKYAKFDAAGIGLELFLVV